MNFPPVIDQIYMGKRYYNSKRIVIEPFVFKGISSLRSISEREIASGTWVLDGHPLTRCVYIDEMKPLDLKWIDRKVAALNLEGNTLLAQATKLFNDIYGRESTL